MKKNHYEETARKLEELKENAVQKQNGGIKIFSMHIPMDMYLAAKEMADMSNISMKKYVLRGLYKIIQEDQQRGTI